MEKSKSFLKRFGIKTVHFYNGTKPRSGYSIGTDEAEMDPTIKRLKWVKNKPTVQIQFYSMAECIHSTRITTGYLISTATRMQQSIYR